MFEKAVRDKVRWQYNGILSVEDLYDLPLAIKEGNEVKYPLDVIFKRLNARAKAQSEESLFVVKDKESVLLNLKIDIIRHIVKVKLQEQEVQENEVIRAARKQNLLSIKADKQDESLREMSEEELQKEIDKL